jgi:signal transduction histidine kinase
LPRRSKYVPNSGKEDVREGQTLRPIHLTVAAALIAGTTTLLVSGLALSDSAYRSTSLHVALETAIAVISIVAAHLIFGRFRHSAQLCDLLLFYAFAALAVSNLLLSALPAALGTSYPGGAATWGPAVGVLVAAALLLASAYVPAQTVSRVFWSRIDWAAAVAVVGGTVGALVVLVGFGSETPDAPFEPDRWIWSDVTTHPEIGLQVVVSLLFIGAAFALATRADRTGDNFLTWIAVGLAVAAFARVNYFVLPSLYTNWVYVGDLLRLAFYVIVFTAAAREISRYQQQAAEVAALQERRRIARDLHDGLAQELAYIATQTKRLALRTDPLDEPREVRYLVSAAERALDESRRAVAALSQPQQLRLQVALALEAAEVAGRVGVQLKLNLDPTIEADPRLSEPLLRIVREAVANAGRHGHAENISVELTNGRGLRLRVVDDGDGFDPHAETDGFGIVSMQERVKALGGRFRIDSAPGRGTEIEVAIP